MKQVSWCSVVDKTLAPLSRGRAFETQVISSSLTYKFSSLRERREEHIQII